MFTCYRYTVVMYSNGSRRCQTNPCRRHGVPDVWLPVLAGYLCTNLLVCLHVIFMAGALLATARPHMPTVFPRLAARGVERRGDVAAALGGGLGSLLAPDAFCAVFTAAPLRLRGWSCLVHGRWSHRLGPGHARKLPAARRRGPHVGPPRRGGQVSEPRCGLNCSQQLAQRPSALVCLIASVA